MPTTTERGLGADHQALRRLLLPLAYGNPCPLCGRLMLEGHKLHLDHIVPRALGGRTGRDNARMTHARCNLARGGRTFGAFGGRAGRGRRRKAPAAAQPQGRW